MSLERLVSFRQAKVLGKDILGGSKDLDIESLQLTWVSGKSSHFLYSHLLPK